LTTSSRARAAWTGLALVLTLASVSPSAGAQTASELKAARELFQEAYEDEKEKRFEEALEKFQRVAQVRESAPVRYRIASVLEQLGRLREARDAYRAIAASKPTLPEDQQEVADAAAQKVLAVDRRIPKLVVSIEEPAPEGARVSVNGVPVPASATPRKIELDPGEHVIQATATNAPPYEKRVTLAAGEEVPVAIALGPQTVDEPDPPPPGGEATETNRTLGYVALGAGGVLLITSAALLIVREGLIGDIETACPGGVCPIARRDEIEGKRSDADLFGPLGLGVGVVGLAAAGLGAYMLLRSSPSTSEPPATGSAPRAWRLSPRARVLQGGAMVGVGATF
jgi:hypothetical protein